MSADHPYTVLGRARNVLRSVADVRGPFLLEFSTLDLGIADFFPTVSLEGSTLDLGIADLCAYGFPGEPAAARGRHPSHGPNSTPPRHN